MEPKDRLMREFEAEKSLETNKDRLMREFEAEKSLETTEDLRASFEKEGVESEDLVLPNEALVRGGVQGLTMGFGDEIAGAGQAAYNGGVGVLKGEKSLDDLKNLYTTYRNLERDRNKKAEKDQALSYNTGEVGAGIIPTLALTPAGYGAVSGVGLSEADSLGELAGDAAVGTATGMIAGSAGKMLGSTIGKAKGAGSKLLKMFSTTPEQAASGLVAESIMPSGGLAGLAGREISKRIPGVAKFAKAGVKVVDKATSPTSIQNLTRSVGMQATDEVRKARLAQEEETAREKDEQDKRSANADIPTAQASRDVYKLEDPELFALSEYLKEGGFDTLGNALQKSVEEDNIARKRAILFSIMQNPDARRVILPNNEE